MIGKVVFTTTTNFFSGKLTEEINLPENLMNGIYLVNVSLDGENFSSKVLLQ